MTSSVNIRHKALFMRISTIMRGQETTVNLLNIIAKKWVGILYTEQPLVHILYSVQCQLTRKNKCTIIMIYYKQSYTNFVCHVQKVVIISAIFIMVGLVNNLGTIFPMYKQSQKQRREIQAYQDFKSANSVVTGLKIKTICIFISTNVIQIKENLCTSIKY